MKLGDAFLTSPFRVEWSDPAWTPNERGDAERGVALAAASVLRGARFVRMLRDRAGHDAEIRVAIETDTVPVHVSTWWDGRRGKFGFALVDALSRERVALVVFGDVPSLTLAETRAEDEAVVEAVRGLVPGDGSPVPVETVVEVVRHLPDEPPER